MKINAECHSDDFAVEVKFDAEEWFKTADDDMIKDLASCDWGGDYAADRVAMEMAIVDEEINKMFDYVNAREEIGFECHVDENDAMAWLRENKPALYAKIKETIYA
jgi:hypothetical protein